jgi:hypothetical protein
MSEAHDNGPSLKRIGVITPKSQRQDTARTETPGRLERLTMVQRQGYVPWSGSHSLRGRVGSKLLVCDRRD